MSNETVETTSGLFVLQPGPGCEILGLQQSACISPQLENSSHTASAPLLLQWGPAKHLALDMAPLGASFLTLDSPLSIWTDQRHIWRVLLSSQPYKFLTWDIKFIEAVYSSFKLFWHCSFTLGLLSVLLSLNAIAILWFWLNQKYKSVQLLNLRAGEGINNFVVVRRIECLRITF